MNGFSAKIGSIVPLGRGFFLIIPGTSCLATIGLSLRDKIPSTAEVQAWNPIRGGFVPKGAWQSERDYLFKESEINPP